MNSRRLSTLCALAFVLFFKLNSVYAQAETSPQAVKEWTVLVFLNGHNSLDSFGKENIDSMATVGSTDQVNVVVQWASEAVGHTKRIYVKKGGYDVIQDMPPADMGDVKTFVNFVKWGVTKYPAKKYLIDIWDHGNGWHTEVVNSTEGAARDTSARHAMDLSYDDLSGHNITTEQLGQALTEVSKFTGGKIELYGSDACLMAMAEVATEMTSAVKYFAGSEETEPGAGWPYGPFFKQLMKNPTWDGGQAAKALAHEYKAAYSGGVYGTQEVTFAAWDLSQMKGLIDAVKTLGRELAILGSSDLKVAANAVSATQAFALADYRDLGDFVENLGKQSLRLSGKSLDDVRASLKNLVLESDVTTSYAKAHGVAVWLPSSGDWTTYGSRYSKLSFNQQTGWATFLAKVSVDLP